MIVWSLYKILPGISWLMMKILVSYIGGSSIHVYHNLQHTPWNYPLGWRHMCSFEFERVGHLVQNCKHDIIQVAQFHAACCKKWYTCILLWLIIKLNNIFEYFLPVSFTDFFRCALQWKESNMSRLNLSHVFSHFVQNICVKFW